MFDDVDEIETDDDDQENGDGGNAREEFEDVDYVRYGGEAYRLSHVADADTLVLDQVHENSIDAPADECTPADVRGNPLDQEADDDDEPKLVTDGGQTIETGDYVEHAGERHRVARVGESHCEIYQLGSVSEIVPISDVIAVPEVPA